MSVQTPVVPVLADPVMIDAALLDIQTAFAGHFTWLNYVFGKAQRMKKKQGEKEITFPGVYTAGNLGANYISAFPDASIGNFIFFDIYRPDTVKDANRVSYLFNTNFGMVVWFDFRTVFITDWKDYTTENVKSMFIDFFRTKTFPTAVVNVVDIFDRAEDIYKGYTDKEIETQFLMRPYGGFRIEGTIQYRQRNC